MAKSIISEGKTTAEAIEKGLKEIGLPKELVDIKVIEEKEIPKYTCISVLEIHTI